MGGHHSKQTVNNSVDIVSNVLFKQTQNCIGISEGKNFIGVFGDGNVVDGVYQDLSVNLDQRCVDQVTNQEKFQSNLKNGVVQSLKDREVALSEWINAGGDTQESDIIDSITTNLTSKVAQKCMLSLSGMNVLVLKGTGNVVENITQEQSEQLISNCLQTSNQAIKTTGDISNSVNQHSNHVSENPLAFISDAIEAVSNNSLHLVIIAFIAFVLLILSFIMLSGRKKPKIGLLNQAPPETQVR